jgi:hypothetical protein
MPRDNNGTSMVSLRQSRITNGSLTHLTSNQMEDQQISDVLLQTQDGGNSLDTKIPLSSMRKERSFKFKETSMLKTETLKSPTKELQSTSNGILFTLMNGKESQRKEN